MAGRPAAPGEGDEAASIFDGAFKLVVGLAAVLVVLMVVRVVADATAPAGPPGGGGAAVASGPPGSASPAPSVDLRSYLEPFPRPAPDIELTGADGRALSLAAMRGAPVLVFFGYTHCPDVCPVTIGAVGEAIDSVGGGARAILVSVDPERDTVPWLAEFVRYMPAGFTAATGSPSEVRAVADAWAVRYARVDGEDPAAYAMAHTADVFVVDAAGQSRARFPFGTEPATMSAVLAEIMATTAAPSGAPSSTSTPGPSGPAPSGPGPFGGASPAPVSGVLFPEVISSSVWAGGASPVILALRDDFNVRIDDERLSVRVQLRDERGVPVGLPVPAPAVHPVGINDVSFVPMLDIPAPGRWQLVVDVTDPDGTVRRGQTALTALDPGGSAALGAAAPRIRTMTATDVDGDLTWLTTDPQPDPRLSATSTADALAAGTPFVLVVDSVRFRVTPVCGRAVVMARQLLDRWRDVPFIHHEPYRFTVVTSEPVLEGSLTDPSLTEVAEAWGVGAPPWGVTSMPWIFVVDGDGIVRAKYQGVMGSADVDVLLTLLTREGETDPAG